MCIRDSPKDFLCFPKDFQGFPKDFQGFPKDFQGFLKDFQGFPKGFQCFPEVCCGVPAVSPFLWLRNKRAEFPQLTK